MYSSEEKLDLTLRNLEGQNNGSQKAETKHKTISTISPTQLGVALQNIHG